MNPTWTYAHAVGFITTDPLIFIMLTFLLAEIYIISFPMWISALGKTMINLSRGMIDTRGKRVNDFTYSKRTMLVSISIAMDFLLCDSRIILLVKQELND
jgi:hypothetical protein